MAISFWSCEHVHKSISDGNDAYFDGHFSDAIHHYNQALEMDSSSFVASFNKGNALYKKQVGVDTLEQHWKSLLQRTGKKEEIANIYHNLGNSFLANGKIKEAIEAYKDALRLKPYYEDTRYNLAYAQKLLPPEQKNKDQNQDQKNQDQKDNKDNKDNQDKKNQDSENKKDEQNKDDADKKSEEQKKNNGEDEQKEGSNNQKGQDQKSGQKQKPQQGKLSKEQAKRLLDHIRRQESGIIEKVNRGKEKNASSESKNKNW